MPSTRVAMVAVPVAVVVLAGCGSAAARPPSCAVTVRRTLRNVAVRTYDQAARGRLVAGSVRRLARSHALSAAVARGDAAATERTLRPLLRDQIKRIVVTRGSRVLGRAGTGAALAPVHGVIRSPRDVPVGHYTLSVGNDREIAKFIRALTGQQVVMVTRGRRVAGTASAREAGLSRSSFRGAAFPHGPLRVWLLGPSAKPGLCGATTAATVANTIGVVGERLARAENAGAATERVLRVVAHDRRFVAAVAARDPAALRAQIIRFFRDPTLHVVRVRAVTASGALVNDVGGAYVLGPASMPLRDGGRLIGRVTLSIQDDTGYIKLMHRLTGAEVVLRTPASQVVPGSALSPGPSSLPRRGSLTYRGRTYQVFSLTASAFPSGRLHVSLLVHCPAGDETGVRRGRARRAAA